MKNLIDYFFDAATRVGMPRLLNTRGESHVNPLGREYRISFYQDDGSVFAVYSDGTFDYDGRIGGRLMRPHDRRWIARMTRDGMYPEFARMQWAEFFSLHEQANQKETP